ncbi:MAG TPA: MBL fold metallo-hydrolase, partial [Gammaproteobacteria bacterium]|nr:MBL fold metallo-hydrolase [Gammaproteobacteria bacterium]
MRRRLAKRYANLDPHARIGEGFLHWQFQRHAAGLPKPPREGYTAFAERWHVPADFATPGDPRAWWLGHATVLLRLGSLHLLTDPHLGQRASPFSFMGPKRLVPVPAVPGRLPKIDIVLISHNHYDHLDDWSIRALLRANPDLVCY